MTISLLTKTCLVTNKIMTKGYAPVGVITVEQEYIEKILPEEFELVKQALSGYNITWDDFALDLGDTLMYYGGEMAEVFDNLIAKFKDKTGLSLDLIHHDQEEGDIYDDCSGHLWVLSFPEVYQLTSEAVKIKKYISRQEFVEFR